MGRKSKPATPETTKPQLPTAGEVVATGRKLQSALSHSRFLMSTLAHLYFGRLQTMATGTQFTGSASLPSASSYNRALESLTSKNALRSVVDTYLSQVVQAPDIRVQSSGAPWKKQLSCRKLGRLLTGAMKAADVHDAAWIVNRDTCLAPVGGVKVWLDDGYRLHVERARPDQVIYNPTEGRKPRNLYLHLGIPRSELIARFPDHADYLKDTAPRYKDDQLFQDLDGAWGFQSDVDLVDVWEHWHLGSGDDNPGYYRLVAGEVDLMEPQEWRLPFFGFVDLRFSESWDSFGGDPLGAQLLPGQTTINRMSRTIDEAQTKSCVPRIVAPKGTEVKGVTNTILEKWEYNPVPGAPAPQIVPGVALPPEYYQRYEREHQRMFELTGVSTSSATGTSRKGLNSGKAIREENETAASRQREHSARNDRWYERIAKVALALMIEAFKDNAAARNKAPASDLVNDIDWSSFDAREDEVTIQCISVAGLPSHPSARLEYVNELVASNLVEKRYALRFLGHPDSEALEDFETAMVDLVTTQVESALYEGKLIPPEPEPVEYLEMLIEVGTRELMKAIRKDAPPEDLELLRRLLAQAKRLKKGNPPTEQPTSPPPPVASPGPPAL